MKLWHFLRSQSDISLPRVITIAAISGLSNASLLMIVNFAANSVSPRNTILFLCFLTAITLYILSQRFVLRMSSIEVEKIIAHLRVSLAAKIRGSDLQSLESIGRSRIYGSLHADTITISQAAAPMILACQGGILVLFSMMYIYYLSPRAFVLTVVLIAIGISIHFQNRKELVAEMDRSAQKENEFFEGLTHLLDGFKEVKLSHIRGAGLFEHMKGIAADAASLKMRSGKRYADYYIFTQVLFYLLIGALVFILPGFNEPGADAGNVGSAQLTRITAAILFIIGPLTLAVSVLPVIRAADHSVGNIMKLQAALERTAAAARAHEGHGSAMPDSFETIEVRDVEYAYTDREGKLLFHLGPVSFTVNRGEVLFLIGGNGSGKSTLLKVLTALYSPAAGSITVDGVDINTLGYRSYRELFSAIFSDYHLFDRLYGMPDVDNERVLSLLKMMKLDRKTSWQNGRFVNQELSTGQKKRLALIVALIEDKPIYVFDEWAADQDPDFRKYFYETLIPDLRSRGKTVICATHDDRYFHVGTRVLKMDIGQLVPYTAPKENGNAG